MTAALYEQVWEIDEYRNVAPGEEWAEKFIEIAKPDGTILDFGCGTGRGAYKIEMLTGLDVVGIDWAGNAVETPITFIPHDLNKPLALRSEYGFCTDVMEHIAPEDVDTVLANILEASRNVFFAISTVPDHFGSMVGEPLHLTVEGYDWWKAKLESHGFEIKWSLELEKPNPYVVAFYGSAYANGNDFAKHGGLNTTEEAILANIKANIALGLNEVCPHEKQDTPIILLAGGPSLAEHEEEIVSRGKAGELIVTTNGAYNWLLERGVKPAAQIMLDARPFNGRFLSPVVDTCKYLLSSQCDHEAVKSLPAEQVLLWHSGDSELVKKACNEQSEEKQMGREWWPVYGGTTVMLRALPLLAMLGFRNIEIFGWDSCLKGDQHHSYSQPENDGARVFDIIVGGRTFKCNPWMIVQANELGRVVRYILGHIDGFQINVRGDGLIAHMLEHAARLEENRNGC